MKTTDKSEKSKVTWEEVRASVRDLNRTLDRIEMRLHPDTHKIFDIFSELFKSK